MTGLRPAHRVVLLFLAITAIGRLASGLYASVVRDSKQVAQLRPTDAVASEERTLQLSPSGSSAGRTHDSSDVFVVALRKVEAAAQEPIPFGSIRIAPTPGATQRTTSVVLPKADSCEITTRSAEINSKSSATYECTWKYTDATQAQNSYENLELQILKGGDWSAMRDQNKQSVRHAAYDASTGAQVHLTLSLSPTKTVKLVIAPGKTEPLLVDSSSLKQSAPEIQNERANSGLVAKQQMSTGMLAVVSDHDGTLFVDGERKLVLTAGKITTLKMMAGQHFVDLRGNAGAKLWEAIVNIPVGAQVAERIQVAGKPNTDSSAESHMAKSELGTPIARNHNEIDQLRRIGERNYTEFTITGKNLPKTVENVSLEVIEINETEQFSLAVTVEGKRFEKKNRNVNQPIFFYTSSRRLPEEIVINKVGKNSLSGYISIPIGAQVAERTASQLQTGQNGGVNNSESPSTSNFNAPPTRLSRSEELFLLGRVPPVSCVADTTKCDGVWDVDANEVAKFCQDFEDQGAKIVNSGACAQFLYSRGENERALTKINLAIEGWEKLYTNFSDITKHDVSQTSALTKFAVDNAHQMPDLYFLRARIRSSLSDKLGALTDLSIGMRYLSFVRKTMEAAAGSNKEVAATAKQYLSLPQLPKMNAHLYRAVILLDDRQFSDALTDYKQFRNIKSSFAELNATEKKLGEIIERGVSEGQGTSDVASRTSLGAEMLWSGADWLCESWCQSATVSVSGIKFSASIDEGSAPKGQSCKTPNQRCVWNLTGTIDGASIDGVVSIPAEHIDKQNCELPETSHKFTAKVEGVWERIVINTESDSYQVSSRDSSTWRWQKPHLVCDGVRLDHTEPVVISIVSVPWNPVATPMPSVPVASSNGGIARQIDAVAQSGRYSVLPQAQTVVVGASEQPSISIQNQTSYVLDVLVAGPVERSISVPAGNAQTLTLPPGTYRVLGRVSSSSVLPFLGTQSYSAGTLYRESFFIK